MGVEYAARYPVMTIGSGPSNSIRGAAFLTGLTEAIVADVGGTTTDFGVLVEGFPREAAKGSMLAGVRTNFRMPDILSLSIGGGTIVEDSEHGVRVGPESLGHRLDPEGWGFGGTTTTLTDAAVAAGRSDLTGRERTPRISKLLREGLAISDTRLSDAIETMNLAQGQDALVVVGGGGFLIADNQPHVKRVIRPDAAQIANAVGVAVAPVSSRWDTIIGVGESRERAIDEAREMAVARAVQAGADPRRVEIVEMEEVALNYLSGPASRLQVRAAGPLGALA
jgi:N-methylhydantoinase A/oxoprolinase/acetone carboxylase beta subunit